jgi:predicted nucleotidyltransferase
MFNVRPPSASHRHLTPLAPAHVPLCILPTACRIPLTYGQNAALACRTIIRHLRPMPQLPHILLEHHDATRRLCEELAVRELRVFGSVITEHFDPSRSDLDFLVDFQDPDKPGIFDRYMALAQGLELIFQRPVDLITTQAMKNPVFRQTVNSTSQALYAA